jgi:cell division ATPase FtsA
MFNLPFLKKSQEDPSKFLSLNINAKDIKCLAFYFDGECFKIIGSGNKDVPEGAVRNGMVIDKESVLEGIKSSVEQALETSGHEIRKVIFGVNGGITNGLTTTIRMKRTVKDPIKPKDIDELYNKIDEAAFVQASKRLFESTGDPDINISSVTTSDVYIKIDDKQVPNLENQSGQNIELAVFNSFVPSFHIKSLQNIANKADLDIIAIGSEMYSLTEWIKSSKEKTGDFVLINLSEDSTDVGVIFGGGIVSTRSLNIGYMHFLESISSKMGLSKKEAENVLKMYNFDKLSQSEIPIIRSCINEVLEIWIDGLKILFDDFPGVKTFASTVYLSGYGIDIKNIQQAIEEESWSSTIPFKDEPKFSKISLTHTDKIINATDKNLSAEWVFVASTSWIYKKILEE